MRRTMIMGSGSVLERGRHGGGRWRLARAGVRVLEWRGMGRARGRVGWHVDVHGGGGRGSGLLVVDGPAKLHPVIARSDSLVRVVSADLVELDVQPPCEPSLPPSFEVACDQVRCYAVADGWAAPFECDASPGDVDWPAWMCDGEAPSIGLDAWDEAGCANSLSTSCLAISGSATFEVWPVCALEQIAG